MSTRLLRNLFTMACAASVLALAPLGASADTKADTKSAPAAAPAPRTQDVLLMKSGTLVKGQILEETPLTVTIMVEFPNMPAVKASYPKSDIVEIKRKVAATDAPPAPDPKATDSKPATDVSAPAGDSKDAKDGKKPDRLKDQQAPTALDEANAAKLLVLDVKGLMGWDTTVSVFKKMFDAVDADFGDLDASGNVKPQFRENGATPHVLVLKLDTMTDPRREFDGFFVAEKFVPEMEKQLGKGRHIVVWIKEVDGGAGFFPLMFKNIYWTADGRIRGTGDLDKFDIGDKMVNEKQISLRMGHVEGMAVEGGYGEVGVAIVRALARGQNWLCVRMEGGKPVFIEHAPTKEDGDFNWFILKDDGKGDNKDKDLIRGNDHLVLEQDWARNLGISKGTADTNEDLAFALGINRNYKVLEKSKSQKWLKQWSEDIAAAWELVKPGTKDSPPGKLLRDLSEIQVQGTYSERRTAYGRKIAILNKIIALFTTYAEAWDEDGATRAKLRVEITKITEQMDLDKRAEQKANGG